VGTRAQGRVLGATDVVVDPLEPTQRPLGAVRLVSPVATHDVTGGQPPPRAATAASAVGFVGGGDESAALGVQVDDGHTIAGGVAVATAGDVAGLGGVAGFAGSGHHGVA